MARSILAHQPRQLGDFSLQSVFSLAIDRGRARPPSLAARFYRYYCRRSTRGQIRICLMSIDLIIACWKARREVLSNQLDMLEHEKEPAKVDGIDITQQDIARLKSQIAELDELLAKYKRRRT